MFLFFITQFLFYCIAIQADKVDDYVKIINEGTERARNYQFPIDNEDLYPSSLSRDVIDFGTYDYIVVGAGTAGAIVAKRLSEAKKKTLLIEAGGDETEFSLIPGMWQINMYSEQNWGYKTKAQKHICQGMIDEKCFYARGKSLGGSSSINGIIYARGNELDQSFWSDFGITGWSWEEVLPYYKKLENFDNVYGDPEYHGFEGPVRIEYSRPSSSLSRYFLQAYDEIGKFSQDLNGKVYMAAGWTHYIKKNGRRGSTNQCYLKDYNQYLTILTKAYVYKIIIQDKKAVGVEFSKDNKRFKVSSKLEVILSAGTTNTPQILMLSGIGPREELKNHNIPIIADLPVGKHFQDHFAFNIDLQANFPFTQKSLEEDVWEYFSGTGRLAVSENFAFAYLSTKQNITNYPDIELFFHAEQTPYHGGINIAQIKKEVQATFRVAMKQIKNYPFSITVVLLHPKSEGVITLQSNSPKDFPLLDAMVFFDEDDINTIYKGVERALLLLNTTAFKKFDVSLIEIILPACKEHTFASEEFWRCYIKQMMHHGWHSVGSCRMGRQGESVLDSDLRVRGFKSLRVIDLSAVPRPNSGHPSAVAMMVGEKGADIVLKDKFLQNRNRPKALQKNNLLERLFKKKTLLSGFS